MAAGRYCSADTLHALMFETLRNSGGAVEGNWGTCPPSSQKSATLSKKIDIKLGRYTFRRKNDVKIPPYLFRGVFFRVGGATAPKSSVKIEACSIKTSFDLSGIPR